MYRNMHFAQTASAACNSSPIESDESHESHESHPALQLSDCSRYVVAAGSASSCPFRLPRMRTGCHSMNYARICG